MCNWTTVHSFQVDIRSKSGQLSSYNWKVIHISNLGAGSPAAGAASSLAGWLLLLRSNCSSGSHPFSFVGLLILVWVVVYYIILLLKKNQEKSLEVKGCRDVTFVLKGCISKGEVPFRSRDLHITSLGPKGSLPLRYIPQQEGYISGEKYWVGVNFIQGCISINIYLTFVFRYQHRHLLIVKLKSALVTIFLQCKIHFLRIFCLQTFYSV